jgi:hypothetical protein
MPAHRRANPDQAHRRPLSEPGPASYSRSREGVTGVGTPTADIKENKERRIERRRRPRSEREAPMRQNPKAVARAVLPISRAGIGN